MASAAGYSQLTRQHPIATPFPPAQQGHAPRAATLSFTYNQLIPVIGCVVWGSAGKARKVADPLHVNLPFWQRRCEIESLHTASLEGYSVSGCGPWAWFSQATLFTSRAVTSLFPVVTFQSLKAITT